jgi:hypothetical protein
VCVCVCVYVYVYVCVSVRMPVYVYVHVCVCLCWCGAYVCLLFWKCSAPSKLHPSTSLTYLPSPSLHPYLLLHLSFSLTLFTFSVSSPLPPLFPPLPSYLENHSVSGTVTQSKIAAVAGDYADGAHLAALLRRQPKGT